MKNVVEGLLSTVIEGEKCQAREKRPRKKGTNKETFQSSHGKGTDVLKSARGADCFPRGN